MERDFKIALLFFCEVRGRLCRLVFCGWFGTSWLMKAYLITTGIIFALIVAAHILKAIEEGPGTAKDPFFIILTLLAAGLCVWAGRLLRKV